jgi:hypothetical protein
LSERRRATGVDFLTIRVLTCLRSSTGCVAQKSGLFATRFNNEIIDLDNILVASWHSPGDLWCHRSV